MKEAYFNTQHKSTNVRVVGVRQNVIFKLFTFFWRWMPGLTRWVALRLFFAPGAYRTNSVEQDCLERGRPFQIQINDKTLHGWKWGHGPAVLLVHGWNGRGIQ